MCGVVAQLVWSDAADCGAERFQSMVGALRSRGPDHASVYSQGAIRLGHTRLSIIDLAGGSQPIFNETNTLACVFNGEIYNFRELRETLIAAGHRFKTHSDTEVLVHGYEQFGRELPGKLVGMFAFIIADFEKNELFIARDRLGEKPLYYSFGPGGFVCASEHKALRHHPLISGAVDLHALSSYLRFGYVEGGQSIYSNLRRLTPGSYLIVGAGRLEVGNYWQLPQVQPVSLSGEQLHEAVRERLAAAVKSQLVADVPLGVFLSGGIDSSAVTAFAAQQISGSLRTFAVGFERELNELPFARQVAQRYGTAHTEIVLPNDIRSILDDVIRYVDEPFADSSVFPTYAVSRAARQHVKVVLTGDGGDELFAGYSSYLDMLHYAPQRWRRGVSRVQQAAYSRLLGVKEPGRFYDPSPQPCAYRQWFELRSIFNSAGITAMLPAALLESKVAAFPSHVPNLFGDAVAQALRFDLNTYLPDDLLYKVDTASMACSLETRAPFLDRNLVEFMVAVPSAKKLSGGRSKGLLREAMRPLLPAEIIDRPKHGFGGPVASWMERDLVEEMRELEGLRAPIWDWFDRPQVSHRIAQCKARLRSDWRAPLQLWSLFMLDRWSRWHQS